MDEKQIRQIIASNVLTLMNEQGLSTTEVARKSNISQGAVSRIINAKMNITVPVALGLAKGLGVYVSDILKGVEDETTQKLAKKIIVSASEELSIGILSINNKRITCIKDHAGKVIGTSDLEHGLDLAETSPSLLQLIQESIYKALPNSSASESKIKHAKLNLVTQSYEFEETRNKFEYFVKKHFKDVLLLPDWIITYLADFQHNPGISLVTDKGVSLSYMENGKIKKLGGWKFPVYDLGGENWLGVETIRHTVRAAEGYIPMSNLARNVLAKFNGKIEKITETCFKGADSDIYCLFAEPLLRSYFTKDKAAKAIIEHGFQLIYESIERVDNIIGKQFKIAMNGSLTDIYKPFFKKERLMKPSSESDKASLLANISKEFLAQYGVV